MIKYEYIGQLDTMLYSDDVDRIIKEVTSEHNDPLTVLIMAGNFGHPKGKLPIVHQGRLFLAVIEEAFTIIFNLDSINVREQIYMIDNEKFELRDTPFTFDWADSSD